MGDGCEQDEMCVVHPFISDVNHEMDVGLQWLGCPPPPVQPVPKGHCSREGFVFQVNFFFSKLTLHGILNIFPRHKKTCQKTNHDCFFPSPLRCFFKATRVLENVPSSAYRFIHSSG